MIPLTIPRMYSPVMTRAALSGKKTAQKKAYMGSFAVHDMNGVSSTVSLLSRNDGSVRLDMTAGTEHPKPISSGTMERPESPMRRNGRSMTNAMRAI